MVITRAPVRVSFGGGGTDLAAYYTAFGGFVVSAAITRYCRVVVRPSPDGAFRLDSADYEIRERFAPGVVPPVEPPLTLPKAAVEQFAARGGLRGGVDVSTAADVPPGTGLGSSSAMAVALVSALAAHAGEHLDAADAAALASWLEIERLGMPIGKQDQYASAFGGLNTIEFRPDGVTVTPLPLAGGVLAALEERLLLFSTGRRRNSADILADQRRDTGAKPAVTEALHGIKRLAHEMRDALLAADLDGFGALLDRAWREKKRLSGKVSSGEIDAWYAAALAAGALGGKITGAGGGGFLLLYCPPDRRGDVRTALQARGLAELTFAIDRRGVTVQAVAERGASEGASPPPGRPATGSASGQVRPAPVPADD